LFDHAFDANEKEQKKLPHSYIAGPVFESMEPDAKQVGILLSLVPWNNFFSNILPDHAQSLECVVTSSCGDHFTVRLDGPKPVFLGQGDLHDPAFDFFERTIQLEDYPEGMEGACIHEVTIYPTIDLRKSYETEKPSIYTCIVVLFFAVIGILFLLYDRLVTVRSDRAISDAQRTSAIVASMFPVNVRDRLFDDNAGDPKSCSDNDKALIKQMNKDFDVEEDWTLENQGRKGKPIADLFPDGKCK